MGFTLRDFMRVGEDTHLWRRWGPSHLVRDPAVLAVPRRLSPQSRPGRSHELVVCRYSSSLESRGPDHTRDRPTVGTRCMRDALHVT